MTEELENLLNETEGNITPARSNSKADCKPGVLKRALKGTYSLAKENSRVIGAVALGVPVFAVGAVVGKPVIEYVFGSILPSSNQISRLDFPDNLILYGLGGLAALYAYGYFGAGLVRNKDERDR